MSLASIEAAFASAAKAEWEVIKAEGIKIEQEVIADAETIFSTLCVQFAPLVMSTISDLATGELAALSGNEKSNLAATTVVDKAAVSGVTILAQDASAMIKLGFEHFKEASAAILAPIAAVAPAVGDLATGALAAAETATESAVAGVAGSATKALGGEPN